MCLNVWFQLKCFFDDAVLLSVPFNWEEGAGCTFGKGVDSWKPGKAEQSWRPTGSETRLWPASWQRKGGPEEWLNLTWHQVCCGLSWYNTLLLTWNSSQANKEELCPWLWIPRDSAWSRGGNTEGPRSQAQAWRSSPGLSYSTDSTESQPGSLAKALDGGCAPPLPGLFCCLFIWKVSKNFSWCALNGSYLLVL